MTKAPTIPCFFHTEQLLFKPRYEWAFGERIDHPESTRRAESILRRLQEEPDFFELRPPKSVPLSAIRGLHNHQLLTVYNTATTLEGDFYPQVFPKAAQTRGDPTNIHHAGAFCFDSGTPLNADCWRAAAWSAACAHHAARLIGTRKVQMAYSLSRPPGHHATKTLFGGYCYLNNSAIAARSLRRRGRVAILDIDYHHGNGTQSIFYKDDRVLTVSIHGDPRDVFPYFAGFESETGAGKGLGFNHNILVPKAADRITWMSAFELNALTLVRNFGPDFLVVAAGLDIYKDDPVGGFDLDTGDIGEVGYAIGKLGLPTLLVQEGGYFTPELGNNAASLLIGVRDGLQSAAQRPSVVGPGAVVGR